MSEEFLTPLEVAEILKLKKNTVYEMIKRGDIPANKLGKQLRIRRDDLDNYLGKQKSSSSLALLTPTLKDIDTNTIIICGQDTILDLLCDRINTPESSFCMLRSRKGSYNGLLDLYYRKAHIATAHMWDPDTDTYNLPYIPKLLPGMRVKVYHILNRNVGFYVQKNNPKSISSFEDLRRADLRFINREKGCGIRILTDHILMKMDIDPKKISGYENEKNSHLECAASVAMGASDFAIGCERISFSMSDIDFIPLKSEAYDMIIPAEYLENPSYRIIVNTLRSDTFKNEVKAMKGYDVTNMGEELL